MANMSYDSIEIVRCESDYEKTVISLFKGDERLGYTSAAQALVQAQALVTKLSERLNNLIYEIEHPGKRYHRRSLSKLKNREYRLPGKDTVYINYDDANNFEINLRALDEMVQDKSIQQLYGKLESFGNLKTFDPRLNLDEIIKCIKTERSSAQALQNIRAQIDASLKQIIALGVPQGNLNNLPQGTETAFLWAAQGRLVLNIVRKVGGATDCLTLFCQNQKTGDRAAKFRSQDGKYALALKLEDMRQWFWCDTHLTGNPKNVYSNITARTGDGVEMRTFFKPFEISSVSRGAANTAFIWRTYSKLPWDSGKDPAQDPSRLEIINQAREQWAGLINAIGNPEKFGLVNGAAR